MRNFLCLMIPVGVAAAMPFLWTPLGWDLVLAYVGLGVLGFLGGRLHKPKSPKT